MPDEIRWEQRFNNYLKAFQALRRAVELAAARELSELEQHVCAKLLWLRPSAQRQLS